MELYFKDLISKESSLEKLVDDLALVVQGADDFAKAVEGNLSAASRQEMASRLERVKDGYFRLKKQAIASMHATDKLLREYPYSSLGTVFVLGLLIGARFRRKK